MRPHPHHERLLGFGASTMQGVGDSEGGFLKRLGALFAQGGHAYTVVNHGVGGDNTRDMLVRLHHARAMLPARTVVLLGSNDLPRSGDRQPQKRTPLAEYAANVRSILGALAGPGAVFVSSFAVDAQRTGVGEADLAAYMAEACLAARGCGYAVWDLYTESLGWQGRYWASDGLHVGPEGHELVARHLFDRMMEPVS